MLCWNSCFFPQDSLQSLCSEWSCHPQKGVWEVIIVQTASVLLLPPIWILWRSVSWPWWRLVGRWCILPLFLFPGIAKMWCTLMFWGKTADLELDSFVMVTGTKTNSKAVMRIINEFNCNMMRLVFYSSLCALLQTFLPCVHKSGWSPSSSFFSTIPWTTLIRPASTFSTLLLQDTGHFTGGLYPVHLLLYYMEKKSQRWHYEMKVSKGKIPNSVTMKIKVMKWHFIRMG